MIRTTRALKLSIMVLCCGLCACGQDRLLPALYRAHPVTVAVTPALNHSGSSDFDPLRVADLLGSELALLMGVKVIPLNRVLAQLESDGRTRVESPAHALQIMNRVGADAIVVFAITEYDPFPPPVVGISAQLYRAHGPRTGGLDPIQASRSPAFEGGGGSSGLPTAQFQWVFHGSDERVTRAIQEFSEQRNAEDSPFGWRKFLASQEHYLRFCCHVTVRELIQQELTQVVALAERQNEVEPE